MGGRERYRVKEGFWAARVVNDETCASHAESGFDDQEFQVGSLIWAYPPTAGLVRFTTDFSAFCVESEVFDSCTERNLLEQEGGRR